jgi:hypothetical protein
LPPIYCPDTLKATPYLPDGSVNRKGIRIETVAGRVFLPQVATPRDADGTPLRFSILIPKVAQDFQGSEKSVEFWRSGA